MSTAESFCAIRALIRHAHCLVSDHEAVCRSERPPRIGAWRSNAPQRQAVLAQLAALAGPARARGCRSQLPPAEVERRIEDFRLAVGAFLLWLPWRCCDTDTFTVPGDTLDAVDIAADPAHWDHAQALLRRATDDTELERQLGCIRRAQAACESMADLADGQSPLERADGQLADTRAAPAHVGSAEAAGHTHSDGGTGSGPAEPPEWVEEHFQQQQCRLLSLLWAARPRGVPESELITELRYTNPSAAAESLRTCARRANRRLAELGVEIGNWAIGHRDRNKSRTYFLEPLGAPAEPTV